MKNLYIHFLAILLCSSVVTSAQVPVLSSYPTAGATIFLDFDGHYVNGTGWNFSGPLTLDHSNLNSTQITEIFQRMSEDYRPFNINITTDSTKYWAAPSDKRMRLIFTITSSWYGNVGGVAYINSFSWGDNTPAFIFTALLNYNTKYIAEAGSHEAGHTLGLKHQSAYDGNCVKTSEYHSGVGSGTIGWAPIMGVGYYRNLTLWNNGANPYGCTNFQDDLSIITNNTNGFGYRNDDHGNNNGGSTVANFVGTEFNVSGIIEKSTDIDNFKFVIPITSNFNLLALPFGISNNDIGSNIDLMVDLYVGSTLLASYNPSTTLSIDADTVLNPGTYYLKVRGVGNTYAPGYASLGSYSLKGIMSPYTYLPVHKLELKGISENANHKFEWEIVADETVTSQVIELSSNGTDFQSLQQLQPEARAFNYLPVEKGILYYRLKVEFDNNSHYYSNVVALKSESSNNRPVLSGNVFTSQIQINSNSIFDYSIADLNGRILSRGKISKGMNTIYPYAMARGMYLLILSNGREQYTEKILKQ